MVYYNKVIIQIINNLKKIKIKMILMIKLLTNLNKCLCKKNKESLENKNQPNKKNKYLQQIIKH